MNGECFVLVCSIHRSFFLFNHYHIYAHRLQIALKSQ